METRLQLTESIFERMFSLVSTQFYQTIISFFYDTSCMPKFVLLSRKKNGRFSDCRMKPCCATLSAFSRFIHFVIAASFENLKLVSWMRVSTQYEHRFGAIPRGLFDSYVRPLKCNESCAREKRVRFKFITIRVTKFWLKLLSTTWSITNTSHPCSKKSVKSGQFVGNWTTREQRELLE